jgi:F-type H+-transporting ATPase subunit alpha
LKQGQFSPVSVEQQVAIVYLAINGHLDTVPVSEVVNFEKAYAAVLAAQYKDTLAGIKAGKIDDSITDVLKKVAKEVASKYN